MRVYRLNYRIFVSEGTKLDEHDQYGDRLNDLISEFLQKLRNEGGGFEGRVELLETRSE